MRAVIGSSSVRKEGGSGLLPAALVLLAAASLLGVIFLTIEWELTPSFGGNLLVAASLMTGVVILAPTYWEYQKGRFDPFHPLTFGAWSYLFPAYSIGGLILAFGWNQPYFLSFIDDAETVLPLSLAYVMLGFLGVCAGFYTPWTRFLTQPIAKVLPDWQWPFPGVWGGGLVLVVLGFALNIVGFLFGLLGYQRVDAAGQFDALIVYLALFLLEGTLLLWLAFFSQGHSKPLVTYAILILLIALIPTRLAFMGSRAELLTSTMSIGMAFWYSGRRITRKHAVIFAALVAASLVIGIIWATTFRNIKGTEARLNSGDYVGQMAATGEYLLNEDPERILDENFRAFLERIETVSSLGVIVSNYEKLAPYEEAYGLNGNIVNDALTAFIPRFVWAEKPPTSDPRAFGDLYFNYADNSFAVTPFGDLLRNFGVIGIFFGMAIIGVYLKVIYTCLIATDKPALWKKMAYYPLLTLVSYEAFFSIFIPSLIRVLFVVVVSVLLVQFLVGRSGKVPERT